MHRRRRVIALESTSEFHAKRPPSRRNAPPSDREDWVAEANVAVPFRTTPTRAAGSGPRRRAALPFVLDGSADRSPGTFSEGVSGRELENPRCWPDPTCRRMWWRFRPPPSVGTGTSAGTAFVLVRLCGLDAAGVGPASAVRYRSALPGGGAAPVVPWSYVSRRSTRETALHSSGRWPAAGGRPRTARRSHRGDRGPSSSATAPRPARAAPGSRPYRPCPVPVRLCSAAGRCDPLRRLSEASGSGRN